MSFVTCSTDQQAINRGKEKEDMKSRHKWLLLVVMAWVWLSKQWELLFVAYMNWDVRVRSLHAFNKPHSCILIVGRDVFMGLCGA